jgi:hypothetical protein
MKFKQFFLETNNTPLIVIDVQPLYGKNGCDAIAGDLMSYINGKSGTVLYFYNGPDIGGDELSEVQEYVLDHGLAYDKLEEIQFREKYYAFFRSWMDQGMSRKHLIKAIRYLVINKITDSRDVSEEDWQTLFGDDFDEVEHLVMNDDAINIPEINVAELKRYNNCYLCGGGEEECLSEFRLLLEAFNIKYRILRRFVY